MCCIIFLSGNPTKGKTENSVKAGRLCCHLFDKEVVAMDNEYIISFMIILLLLVISIKK